MSWAPFLAPERDALSRIGRAKRAALNYYTVPGIQSQSQGSVALAANTDYLSPWFTPTPIVFDRLACEVTAGAGTNLRIGFYAADADLQPVGAPLVDSGNLDASTPAVKTYDPGSPIYVPRGRYVSIINADGAPTMRRISGEPSAVVSGGIGATPYPGAFAVSRTYAAFTTPGTVWDTTMAAVATGMHHFVLYRIISI